MTALPVAERDFARQVDELLPLFGFQRSYHTYDSRRSHAGFPDCVAVNTRDGRVVFLELKSSLGRLTLEQAAWLSDLREAGQEAHAIWPRDWDALVRGLQSGDWSGLQGPPQRRRPTHASA